MSTSSIKSEVKNHIMYTVRAIYLGSEPMGELLEGENGSDAVQVPLKRTILRTDGVGDEVDVIISDDSLNIHFIKADIEKQRLIQLPIETLAYCGALKQLAPEKVRDREFETLDKIPNDPKIVDPPLFVTIFRSFDNQNTLLCHSFVIRKDTEAMELVKHVMEAYYNIVGQLEQGQKYSSDLSFDNTQDYLTSSHNNTKSYTSVQNGHDESKLSQTDLDRLLEAYNRTDANAKGSILNNRGQSQFVAENLQPTSLSARDIFDPSKYEIIQGELKPGEIDGLKNGVVTNDYSNVPLNTDEDPIIIKKKNDEQLVYKQNVFIRWLQPPTPPPPAPIIIREVQAPPPEPLPPLVIYKQPPREPTPPPLIIREKPPSPVKPTEPIIIERRIAPPEQPPRRVIVEQLPPPPQKPRDIILEKWLPRETASKRPVIIEKVPVPVQNTYSRHTSAYDYVDARQLYRTSHQSHHQQPYEVIEKSRIPSSTRRIIKHVVKPRPTNSFGETYQVETRRSASPVLYPAYPTQHQHHHYYNGYNGYNGYRTSHHKQQPHIAGYRVIRQIIPGPNATQADIERALARSQRISTANYSKHHDYTNGYYHQNSPPTSDRGQLQHYQHSNNKKPITVEQIYVPHSQANKWKTFREPVKSIYKSTSID